MPGAGDLERLLTEGEEERPEEAGAPTDEEAALVRGLFNINTASADALLCLPQMTEEIAQEIAARAQAQPFETLGDLLAIERVDAGLLKQIIQHITVRSLAFRTVARGTLEERGVVAEVTAVVDLTQSEPRLVYYKRGDTTANVYRPAGAARLSQ